MCVCVSPALGSLCVAQLTALLQEMESSIRRLSEELVQMLALREGLDFEKEVKVQNLQKEHRDSVRRRRRRRRREEEAAEPPDPGSGQLY